MEKLLEIKKQTLYSITGVITFLAISLFGISFMKIEQTMEVLVSVGHDSTYLMMDSASVYRIKNLGHITININNIYYKTSISKIEYNNDSLMFDVLIFGLGRHLIPDTTLNAEVIYGEKRIYELVFNAGV